MRNDPGDARPFIPRDLALHPAAFDPGYKTSVLRSPRQALISFQNTPTEITGPMFGHDTIGPLDHDLTRNWAQPGLSAIGERIIVHGRLMDGEGRPVPDALIEIWQTNAGGRYRHVRDTYVAPLDPNFGGCGRTLTREDGSYAFMTVRPGAYPWPNRANDWRPAHIHFSVFGHGFAQRLITQMYFEGDPSIPLCPIVGTVPDAEGIAMMTATLDMDATVPFDARAWRFDIVLRGRRSTPFENRPEGN
ncbi:protocatechuate 3,4-dioxygenase subunit beta [Acuticoccus mangrovi]|uniref:Protocatechuate 3,4-dioxygenase subunit beta n=1 Tax=Acuticoccus mangrovi TaxID=2796142 RepID=A0A934IN04_9HYPH|nr:protocatechuate 3,4-dioxygenase subunit beta [Acuticoccus mangrovi]